MTPELNWRLRITPAHYNHAFWQSTEYRQLMHTVLYWNAITRIFGDILVVRRYYVAQALEAGVVWLVLFLVLLGHVFYVAFYWQMKKQPEDRQHLWIERFVLFTRTVWVIPPLAHFSYANFINNEGSLAALRAATTYIEETSPSASIAARNLVFTSFSALPFLFGVNTPLMFIPQLFANSLFTLSIVFLMLPHSAHALEVSGPTGGIQLICYYLDELQYVIQSVVVGPTFDGRTDICKDPSQYLTATVLFTQLFVGIVLPVYFAYRMEWVAKRKYVLRTCWELDEADWEEDVASEPWLQIFIQDLSVLAVVAMVTWAACCHLHTPLLALRTATIGYVPLA